MKRVTGIGGVFFKTRDREKQLEWYRTHLGIESDGYGFMFAWRDREDPESIGYTVWSPFKDDTDYFDPSTQPFMVNYRVDDLDALVAALKEEGVEVVGEIQQEENGKFAWILDPEGNKIELWEPVPSAEDPYLPG
jgi:predicted enzyme related to lactoylglutathione lyase